MGTRNVVTASLAAALLAASATTAMAASNGLYSADELMDADVYLAGHSQQVGEVEDLILDDSLTVGAFVVETDDVLGLSGKTYLVDVEDVQVRTVTDHGEQEYRVTIDASPKQLEAYPEYSHSWWDNVRAEAGKAWTHTRNAAQDAWSRITDAAGDLVR